MSFNSLLLAFLTAGKCLAEVAVSRPATRITDLSTPVDISNVGYQWAPTSSGSDGTSLLDIVLVASVDGKLHALNRSSGDSIWSMAASSEAAPATLGPLVRTQHPDIDPDLLDDDSEHQEVYVVEPQSGDIFVMSSPHSPLQRLPFSMPQLVDMSPFRFSADDDGRVFIGRKETSLLLIELETGKVKATLNSECPWDPFQDLAEPAEFDIDLDELDGTKPPKVAPKGTEVFIGRTDYHVSILTHPSRPSSSRPPMQKLSFSVYGPNNEDLALQSLYRHTADSAYIQPLPSGEILSFKTVKTADADITNSGDASSPHLLWGHAFSTPIVAVFDVLRAPDRANPFVLLQPRIHLQDILPSSDLRIAAAQHRLPNVDSAFVGIVEETGSLFAMSPDSFPLVVFGDVGVGRFLSPSPMGETDLGRDLPQDLDSVTRRAKERRLRRMCKEGSTDRRCLTGVRRLESSSQSRLSRLLDGAPYVPPQPSTDAKLVGSEHGIHAAQNVVQVANSADHSAVTAQLVWDSERDSRSEGPRFIGDFDRTASFSVFALCALALLAAFVWNVFKRVPSKLESTSARTSSQVGIRDEKDSPIAISTAVDFQSHRDSSTLSQPLDDANTHPPAPALRSVPSRPQTPRALEKSVVSDDVRNQDPDGTDDAPDGDESEKEGDTPATPGKRKGIRRKRGKKKKGGALANGAVEDGSLEKDEKQSEADNGHAENGKVDNDVKVLLPPTPPALVIPPPLTPTPAVQSLVVSDTVLGFGSHGTVVFKGSLQGRAVAVKRLLQDFVTLASREVNVLQESDDHPNVIRYYYQESQANFLYIALELCPASLADIIEHPDDHRDIAVAFEPKRALRQITAGLRHLHGLKIIHRDIKPQNILISHAKRGVGQSAGHRMLISDFGLCKKLDMDQTSFLPTAHGAMAAGTVGWRAPEILRGEVKLDDVVGDESQSSRGSVGSAGPGTPTGKPTRLTKSVDIFALGCLYYYVLTNGGHPFGDRYEREVNILKNSKSLDGLERFGEEGSEGADLINRMLNPDASDRPDTSTCLLHPYFWDPGKRLTFLQDASDRFEIMCRDPRDPNLVLLENGAVGVVGNDWHSRLDKLFIENLGKFRKYDGRSVQDLLRALRNKKHHYQDLPDNVKRLLGSMPEGFLAYFTRRFPLLFLHVHSVVSASSLRNESMFRTYFELVD